MNRNNWLSTWFHEGSRPDWSCPYCKNGKLVKHSLTFDETNSSKWSQENDPQFQIEWTIHRVTGIFKCSHCSEVAVMIGKGSVEYAQTGPEDWGYEHSYEPKYFEPPIQVFQISKKCPKPVREEIIKAFSLFWCDYAACATKIRIAIEHIMDDQGIKNWGKDKKNKRVRLFLGVRLQLFEAKTRHKDVAKHLKAIKWIANEGSHVGELNREDLLDGFELLEYSLEQLYDNKNARLIQITNSINKKKKPRSHLTSIGIKGHKKPAF